MVNFVSHRFRFVSVNFVSFRYISFRVSFRSLQVQTLGDLTARFNNSTPYTISKRTVQRRLHGADLNGESSQSLLRSDLSTGLREGRFVGQHIIGMSENIGLGKNFQMRHKLWLGKIRKFMFGGVHRKLLCLSVWASMATKTVNPYCQSCFGGALHTKEWVNWCQCKEIWTLKNILTF